VPGSLPRRQLEEKKGFFLNIPAQKKKCGKGGENFFFCVSHMYTGYLSYELCFKIICESV
jgi:hypothetical protein